MNRLHIAQQEVARLEAVVLRRSAKFNNYEGEEVNYSSRLRGRVIRAKQLLSDAEARLAKLSQ